MGDDGNERANEFSRKGRKINSMGKCMAISGKELRVLTGIRLNTPGLEDISLDTG